MSKNKKIKVLVICPHPDDGEFGPHQLIVHAVKAGWDVHQLIMTGGEYGTENPAFMGERLRKIRRNEMETAARLYDPSNYIKIHWGGYIDQHLRFGTKAVNRLADFIAGLSPDITAAPDPFYQVDFHPDHINTGLIYYFALKKLANENRLPRLNLFYYTSGPDFFLPLRYLSDVRRALSAHKSQVGTVGIIASKIMPYLIGILHLPRTAGRLCQGYRRVILDNEKNYPRGIAAVVDILSKNRRYKEQRRREIKPLPPGIETDPDYPIE